MSEPISLPVTLHRFLHPHMAPVEDYVATGVNEEYLYCESIRPLLDPMLEPLLKEQGYVRDFTPCGQIIHWRLK
ncbi:hypothetical protein LCGC14_3137690 [marine sediment metagenome]|uniref:Uncharacterized protein n=1 Tax=marine sediment metagenome TaxID=412755 RepID=A0A0F8YM59_9ZZZZ